MDYPLIQYGIMIVVGMVLGVIFFGGLWATVRKLPTSKRPGLLAISSMILRTAIVCWGVWYFSNGDAGAMVACLLGFVGVRLLATHGRSVLRGAGSE
ncbi:ATP synthase subunit I [Fuerstiella marisgermanici]|uniref:F1/F0 ATPase, Methanosarcina type, subunit 2 n=1 Tax=Fuerstiella marisgermanici TaxID=1891926 RepID=A0A1P8WLM4_9PLAN|nr:ATP synthase subunit I [Fuerstiella marisgermanici]APZ94949.1 F1/F0 ATPase, Methanosarcina type, subunit 2 [Fuerstiella marisgermanici]